MIPVFSCSNCDFAFTDSRAEDAKHSAVCSYLGRLNPQQIRDIRKISTLSRTELSELTGIGKASLQRWEKGLLIQNKSCDRLIRLLAFPQNVAFLKGAPVSPMESSEFKTVPSILAEETVVATSNDIFLSLTESDEVRVSSALFTNTFLTGDGLWWTEDSSALATEQVN